MNKQDKKQLLKNKIQRLKQRLLDAELLIAEICPDSNPEYLYLQKKIYIKKGKK
tara:strand:+ start:4160 stop:4321 length:162 start_codon:yes stop_codon:yes gene_type:complete